MNTTMTVKATKPAPSAAVAAMLGLWLAIGLSAPLEAEAEGAAVISQYCAPPDDALDLHRVYCQREQGAGAIQNFSGLPQGQAVAERIA